MDSVRRLRKLCAMSVVVVFLGGVLWCVPCVYGDIAPQVAATDTTVSTTLGDGWVSMPAGARPAFIGINGGTVPVSLLIARDGQSMATFVGLTGNDFLQVLHSVKLSNSTKPVALGDQATVAPTVIVDQTVPPVSNATVLMASTAIGNIPVFYCTGKTFTRLDDSAEWLPFGLSETPLLLEGQVNKPVDLENIQRAKKVRRFLLMQRFKRPTLSAQ